jgi:DHA1 family multidrug resistance protein-like MFS transporter
VRSFLQTPAVPWRRTLWLMVGVQALMACAFSISGPFLPLYVIQLGVHPIERVDLWAGAIASSNFFFAAIFSPIWGSLADRVGRKAMVVRSCVAICIFTAVMGLVQNVWQLLGTRALMGVFSGFSAASTALVGTLVPEEQLGFSLGWMATGQLAGALIGPLLGGLLATKLHGYRDVFFWTSGFALAAVLLCTLFVREQFSAPAAQARRLSFVAGIAEVARHPQLLPMFGVVLVAQVVAFGVQPVVPLYVRSIAGDVPWLAIAAGAAFAVMGFADLLASPFLGKRSDKIGYRRVLLISLAGVAAFTIPQAFAWSIASFLAMRFGVGMFLGGVLPTANPLIGRLFPAERRGQVYGITSSATFLGMCLGPLIGGSVAARFGFPAVFLTIGTLTLVNLAWVAFSVPRGLPESSPTR